MAEPHGVGWQDQWLRIHRWYERVRQSRDDGRPDGLGTDGYRDEVFALFQAVWHLKDWIKNDPALDPKTGETVDLWVNGRPDAGVAVTVDVLKVVADVANGTKHLVQRPKDERAGGSRQSGNDVTVMMGIGVRHSFYVLDRRTGKHREALAVVDDGLMEWKAFLAERGISTTSPDAA